MDKVKQVGISNSEDGPIYSIEDSNSLENKPEFEAKSWVEGQHRPEEDSLQCPHACKRWFRIEMKSNHMNSCTPDLQ